MNHSQTYLLYSQTCLQHLPQFCCRTETNLRKGDNDIDSENIVINPMVLFSAMTFVYMDWQNLSSALCLSCR